MLKNNKTTVYMLVGFAAGYHLGRHYNVSVNLEKVSK